MRILVCQTPKLTYVQAIELLKRETAECGCDLVLLPEMALEHPPQCTCQGEISFENVAFLMLSRFARQRQIYIVVGSVEERTPFAAIYDTCIVLDRQGEFLLQYRKQSVSSPAREAGEEPGLFETEFGLVGLLLGAEVEEEQRWAPLIAQRPCVLLNPTREPTKMDPVLAKAHPELQVAAWHEGFSRLERIVDLQMRSYACPFVRADAPLQEGGAGVSILVEQHRSVVAPSWGSVFFMIETSQPSDLVSRRLPGWRYLTIDERIEAAQREKEVLLQEEIMRGPRYLVWTFRLPQAQLLALKRDHGPHWASQSDGATGDDHLDRSWLIPLTSHGGRSLYVVATKRGCLTIWDVRQKKDIFTCNLGVTAALTQGLPKLATLSLSLEVGAVVAALGPWHMRSQFIMVSAAPSGLMLRVFDESNSALGTVVGRAALPWTRWACADHVTGLPLPGPYPEDGGEQAHPPPTKPGDAPPDDVFRPTVRAIYPFDHLMAIAVIEGPGSSRVPMGLLIDLELGSTLPLDLYGAGPVEPVEEAEPGDESAHWRTESDKSRDEEHESREPSGKDVLVGCHLIEQRFQERSLKLQRALVCLYRSNRICLLTCGDWKLHEQLLLEEMASTRQRTDVPLACAMLPNPHSGSYHIMVSYESMVIRWWQASISQCRLLSHVLLTSVATHLAILEWPMSAPPEKPEAAAKNRVAVLGGPLEVGVMPASDANPRSRPGAKALGRLPAHVGRAPAAAEPVGVTRLPPIAPTAYPGPAAPPAGGRLARQSTATLAPQLPGNQAMSRRSVLRIVGVDAVRGGHMHRGRSPRDSITTRTSFTMPSEEAGTLHESEFAYHAASLLVVAFETSGAMPIFLANGGRIARVYECWDHFVYKATQVDQLWCLDRSIAVQLSNGDVRHFEFLVEGEVINLVDMPIEGT